MINRWVVYYQPFVIWKVTFGPTWQTLQLDPLLYWGREVLKLGKEYAVFRVVETRQPFSFSESQGQEYADFMETSVREHGAFAFFPMGEYVGPMPEGPQDTRSTICYYGTEGEIVESEVGDLSKVIRQLRPDTFEDDDFEVYLPNHGYPVAPVTIATWRQPLRDDEPLEVFISLYTDIWFPEVMGLQEKNVLKEPGKMYDNHALAACHTPRLNQFLTRVKDITLEVGASWRLMEPHNYKPYAYMVSESGIKLDIRD